MIHDVRLWAIDAGYVVADVISWGVVLLWFGIIYVFPIYLTCYNIRRIFHLKQNDVKWKGEKSKNIDLLIFLLLPVYMGISYLLWWPKHWSQQLWLKTNTFPYHEPVSRDYALTFFALCITAWCGFLILRFAKRKLPPLLTVLCMGTVYLGCFLSIAFIIQVIPNAFEALLPKRTDCIMICLFPLNYIFFSVAAFNNIIRAEEKLESEQEKKGLAKIGKLLRDSSRRILLLKCLRKRATGLFSKWFLHRLFIMCTVTTIYVPQQRADIKDW